MRIALEIAVIAAVTAALRFLPFWVLKGRQTPPVLVRLGKTLPFAVMGMLVVYCLKDVSFREAAAWLPQLIAVLVTGGSYVWKRNTLLSILLGTVCYMILLQRVFL